MSTIETLTQHTINDAGSPGSALDQLALAPEPETVLQEGAIR